jgi:dethiobiotin synthetase
MKVRRLTGLPDSHFHAEKYKLSQPLSPHASAIIDGVSIQPDLIQLPETKRNLIIEGAGGLMVPLTTNFLVIDLIAQFNIPVILVSAYYLGSINHTLLSAEALEKRNIPVKGIIFNGNEVKSTREVIESYTGLKTLYHLPYTENLSSQFIDNHARQLAEQFT